VPNRKRPPSRNQYYGVAQLLTFAFASVSEVSRRLIGGRLKASVAFTPLAALRYHNLFGFYIKGNKCKKFESDEECIEYYKKWQDKRYDKWRAKYPKADYYHFLKYVKYATGDKYTNELKPKVTWVKKHLVL